MIEVQASLSQGLPGFSLSGNVDSSLREARDRVRAMRQSFRLQGELLTAVGVTPGGLGVTETGTAAALVAWGADPAASMAGVVLFSIFTHFMEIPLGALGWIAWSLMPRASARERAATEA